MATSIFRQNFPGTDTLQHAADTAAFLIGLDVHKKTVAICVVDPRKPEQPVFQRKRLQNVELLSTLQKFPGKQVVVCEAAYGWFALRDALSALPDVTLILLDSRKTGSWIATSGIKDDRIDAQVLCHACLNGGIRALAVHQPSRESRERLKLVQHREQLVRQRTKTKNQLAAMERDYGPNPFTGEVAETPALVAALEADLRGALEGMERRIDSAEGQIAALSKDDEIIKLLQSVPGIGTLTAFALRHKIESIERFAAPSNLSSYFGFGVRQWHSGDRGAKGGITKTGSRLIRTLLVQGAHSVRNGRSGQLSLYFPALAKADLMANPGHANKVVTAVARKNLTFVYHVWKNRTPFDLERYRERRAQSAARGGETHAAPNQPVASKDAADLVGLFAR